MKKKKYFHFDGNNKSGSTLADVFSPHYGGHCRAAFTLAEVLITLGIIGIVAAMTLPALIANGRKQEVTARLKKFNSMILQAILLSENDNGPSDYWNKVSMPTLEDGTYDADTGSVLADDFFRAYFLPYIKYLKYENNREKCSTGPYIIFNDGSTACIKNGGCIDFYFDTNGDRKPNKDGYDKFYYVFCNAANRKYLLGSDKKSPFFPYYSGNMQGLWNDRNGLLQRCSSGSGGACARLIEFDGFEIKDDYPFKI